jgi:hypothetical protein
MSAQPPKSVANDKRRVLLVFLKHLGCYLLGILACILLTPVDFTLAGKALWPLYPLLAVIGFFVYFTLSPTYTFGNGVAQYVVHWLVFWIGLAAVVLGVAAHFRHFRRIRFLSPLLISFSIGFVGTLGVYYGAAASI